MSNLSPVEAVRRRIAAAVSRSGRSPGSVTLIAVTKTRTLGEIQAVLAQGITQLGENRVQELKEKWPHLQTGVTWHLIGSLQTNKVKQALEMASLIHSLDRDSLATELAKAAARRGTPCQVLVQVNVSGEDTKHGVAPGDLVPFLERISALGGHVQVRGLMTMAPLSADPESARPHFRRLREIAGEVQRLGLPHIEMEHLSMGMSGDFETAIEEGATLVRVGTALFGARV